MICELVNSLLSFLLFVSLLPDLALELKFRSIFIIELILLGFLFPVNRIQILEVLRGFLLGFYLQLIVFLNLNTFNNGYLKRYTNLTKIITNIIQLHIIDYLSTFTIFLGLVLASKTSPIKIYKSRIRLLKTKINAT